MILVVRFSFNVFSGHLICGGGTRLTQSMKINFMIQSHERKIKPFNEALGFLG
jgi:hypothetical protein